MTSLIFYGGVNEIGGNKISFVGNRFVRVGAYRDGSSGKPRDEMDGAPGLFCEHEH